MNLAVKFYSQVSNPRGIPGAWPAETVELGDGTTLPDGSYTLMSLDEFKDYIITHQAAYDAWYIPYVASLPANAIPTQSVAVVSQPDPSPFAVPTYRTKRDASTAWVTCPADTITSDDYKLLAERYVNGGEVVLKDTQEGDYISAQVYDLDGVIPSGYRAALCEAWPVVAEYIVKQFVKPVSGYSSIEVNTYPLNAKVTAGLYLRVSYHATSAAGDRKMVVNYFLTKKL